MASGAESSDQAFRAEVRAFLAASLPEDMARRNRTAVHPTREDILGWQAILARRGWSVVHWPPEYGGSGWPARRRHIFEEELMLAGAPASNIQGISLVGPVIYTFGTEAQKERYLPPIREGREFWAQGFSEPNAGSDLASLKTRAVRDGDVWVVNGQKIWTSQAMMADLLFCLVRTDPTVKAQLGISFLLIPLELPGITIRPIGSIDGGESLCEVFFSDVRVPAENLVGAEGKGWDYAKFLLGNERVATAEAPRNKRNLALLKEIARAERSGNRALIDDPPFRSRIAALEIDLLTLEGGVTRALDGEDNPLLPSVLKLSGTELMQSLLQMQVEALGAYGAVYHPQGPDRLAGAAAPPGPAHSADIAAEFLFRRAATIYGGSNEVQKNIIAKVLLRDFPRPSRNLDEQRRMLSESAERFLERSYGFEERRAIQEAGAPALRRNWRRFAELGWLGAALPEEAGGLGGSAADTALLSAAFGRALVLEPYLGCAVLAGRAIDAAGTPAQRRALLPGLVSGETLFALAHDEPGARGESAFIETTARPAPGGGFVLDGTKSVVLGGDLADRFLVSARSGGGPRDRGGVTLFLLDRDAPGLACRPCRLLDGRGAADLVLDKVRVAASAVLGRPGDALPAIEDAVDHGIMAGCAEAVGAMEEALRITCDYLKLRQQFGRPLAEFQALQHRVAEMLVELEKSRSMLQRGLDAVAEADPAERRRAVSASKARIGRSGAFVGGQAIQLHGGIGMTEEYPVGHYFKRLCVLDILFGNAHQHAERYAEGLS